MLCLKLENEDIFIIFIIHIIHFLHKELNLPCVPNRKGNIR